jgi:putative transcriptional regulator
VTGRLIGRSARGDDAGTDGEAGHRVVCHLDALLEARSMTLAELAARAGVTVVNLSVLKNNRARAVRFSTLTAICDVLDCQPGDVLGVDAP